MYCLIVREAKRKNLVLASAFMALFASACGGGALQFQGQLPISVAGTPPAPPAKRVEVQKDQIVIREKVQFAYNAATILPQSFSLLDEVATTIKDNPQLTKIEVGGHASTEGSDEHNRDLSERRAQSVKTYLVDKAGVKGARLSAEGYGETKPLVTPDDTEAKREENRRVEFVIVERGAPAATDPAQASN